MGYIVICYLIFYAAKRFITDEKLGTLLLTAAFALWFLIESLLFAQESMPFLRARQMLSFPCGVLIAQHKSDIEKYLTKAKSTLICAGGGYNVPSLYGCNSVGSRKATSVFAI